MENLTAASEEFNSTKFPFCENELKNFNNIFSEFHFKLSLIICIFGVVTNIVNFIVLTRKSLRSEINTILTALAISDGLVMLVYMPFVLDYAFDLKSSDERRSYGYCVYLYFHATLSQFFHTISIFITIVLAFYRYISVCQYSKKKLFINRSIHMMILSCVFTFIITIPYFFSMRISESHVESKNLTLYLLGPTELSQHHHIAFIWIYSVVIKLFPCILLTFFSFKLIQVLFQAKKSAMKNGISSSLFQRRRQQTDRTTFMLILVLILFLCTEFPQALLGLFSAVLHENFYLNCYQNLGNLLDFLALLNSSINFIIYCSMSRKFREVFKELFICQKLSSKYDNELIEMDDKLTNQDDTNFDMTQNITLNS